MSTIPGGCFVAPDSLRRLNKLQKKHATEAKLQQASTGPQSPPLSPPLSPPVDVPGSPSLARLITNAPIRFTEMFSRSRSSSSPPGTPLGTPPVSPCISPRKLPLFFSEEGGQTPPPSPFLSPRKQSPLSKKPEPSVATAENKTELSLSKSF